MNNFLNNNNGPSLTGIIDITANIINLLQEDEHPKYIHDIFINQSVIRVAEPYDASIDETRNNVITMYQFIGDTNDTKVAGLESLLNYMNEHFFSKDEPAVNEHHYHRTNKLYNQDFSTNNIHKVGTINFIRNHIIVMILRLI